MRSIEKRYGVLVFPNDPLSVYIKQGNLHQFIERFEFYAEQLGEVYIYNVDDTTVSWPNEKIHILNEKRSKNRLVDFLKKIIALRKISKQKNVSFIRVLEGGNFIKSAIAGIAGLLSGKPVVVSLHGTYRGLSETQNYKWYHHMIFGLMEIITKSTASLTFVIDSMYMKELGWKNMYLIPNFVDEKLFSPKKNVKKWVGIYVGALHNRKGISYLIKTIEYVRKRIPNARFAVAGAGELKRDVENTEGVDYLGPVKHEKLPACYNTSAIFVTATLHEGFAIPLVEAQACSLPIVATNLPPFHNNTIPGKTSLLVPVKNPKKMADVIVELYGNPKKAAKMGKLGREFVLEKFGKENVLNEETKLIRRYVNKFYERSSGA